MYVVHVAPLCNLKALSFAMSKYINVGTENGCSNWEHGLKFIFTFCGPLTLTYGEYM